MLFRKLPNGLVGYSHDSWEVPAGSAVKNGYGAKETAPSAAGVYRLWEVAFGDNTHSHFEWEKL